MWHLLTDKHHLHSYIQSTVSSTKDSQNNVRYIFRCRFSGLVLLFLNERITSKALSINRSIGFCDKALYRKYQLTFDYNKTRDKYSTWIHLLCPPLRPSCLHCHALRAEVGEHHYTGEWRGDKFLLDVVFCVYLIKFPWVGS